MISTKPIAPGSSERIDNVAMNDEAMPAAESEIVWLLRSSTAGSKDRRNLLRQLGDVPTSATAGVLGEYLDSADARDGVAAVLALRRIGTASAIATLSTKLPTALPLVGAYIARALINLDARSELPAILAYLRDGTGDDAGNKQFVIDAMRKMPHVSEVPVLTTALSDRSPAVRKSAAITLGLIRAPESTASLRAAADELGFWNGRHARRALRARQVGE